MREEFERLAAAGKITRQQIEPLMLVGSNGYVFHRSWGVGKVATWDWLFSKVVIDFQSRERRYGGVEPTDAEMFIEADDSAASS